MNGDEYEDALRLEEQKLGSAIASLTDVGGQILALIEKLKVAKSRINDAVRNFRFGFTEPYPKFNVASPKQLQAVTDAMREAIASFAEDPGPDTSGMTPDEIRAMNMGFLVRPAGPSPEMTSPIAIDEE